MMGSIAGNLLNEIKKKPGIALIPVNCKEASSVRACKNIAYKYVEVIDGYWHREYVRKANEHNLTYGRESMITSVRSPCQIAIATFHSKAKEGASSSADSKDMLAKFKDEKCERFTEKKYGKNRLKAFMPLSFSIPDPAEDRVQARKVVMDLVADMWEKRIKISDLEPLGGLKPSHATKGGGGGGCLLL